LEMCNGLETGGANAVLGLLRRVAFINQLVNQFRPSERLVLEIGCFHHTRSCQSIMQAAVIFEKNR